jgi:tricorn protease
VLRPLTALAALLLLSVVAPLTARSQAPIQAFLRRPDISGDRIIFTCEGDLWLGSVPSGAARRLTTDEGLEGAPRFSPDGTTIAFTGSYDGGQDVYVMPVEGGAPKRLTYEATGAVVMGWTPDSSAVLFRSRRNEPQSRSRLWKVAASGGMPAVYPIPRAEFGSLHQDGKRMAYVPVSAEWQHWKRYQGGQADDVWITDVEKRTFQKLTDFPGVDTTPVWVGDQIYFVSERDDMANLWRIDPNGGSPAQVTKYEDYDVEYPSTDGKRIVFQHGNGLALYDVTNGQTRDLQFQLATDRIHTRPKRVAAAGALADADLGPTGKRLVIEARGQLFSVPAENGDVRTIASLPGSRSRNPSWSPDGKWIAFVSDRSGEEQVWLAPATGSAAPRQLTKDHRGPLGNPLWSPDSKWIAIGDHEMRVLLVDAESGETTQVDQGHQAQTYHAINSSYRFSPDGKWLAYYQDDPNQNGVIYLYEIATKQKAVVTDARMNSYSPAFDSAGKYLFFLSDRNFDPNYSGPNRFYAFDKTTKVTLVTLAADTPSPFLLENDEEGPMDKPATPPTPAAPAAGGAAAGAAAASTGGNPALPTVKVDLEGIQERLVEVPLPADRYQALVATDTRLLLLTAGEPGVGAAQLRTFDLKSKAAGTLVPRLSGFTLSANGKKLLIRTGPELVIADAGAAAIAPGSGRVDLAGAVCEVDPVSEWRQIFNESWRLARDFFYDPGLHGVDWEAVKRKYAAQLPAVGDRSDLNILLGEMIGELNVGHAYVQGGDGARRVTANLGFLGADLEPVTGLPAYRITKLYPGDEFELTQRSPLLAPGLKVKRGGYLLAIGGRPVSSEQDPQALLAGTAGRVISLTVNDQPSMEGAREIRIRPIASENGLRYYDWVTGRREYLRSHGGENLGYVHIPDMSEGGLKEFGKHYFPSRLKDGIVYDVRNNGGGFISAMLLLQLGSKPYTYFKPRYGTSWTRQDWAFPGYGVALCNEGSGSNAEEFCDGFQRLKLGPVIGVRTWGGEVGSGGGYRLIDGGALFIPNYAEWGPEGKWLIEGTGVTPDITVENDPAAEMDGRDPQLDRAIAYLKEQIAKSPVPRPEPPPFPVKAPRPRKK